LIAKENEIGRLQKHIDKQDSKFDAANKSNENLKDQIKQSTSGGDLS
jgi:cell division protein FtsL